LVEDPQEFNKSRSELHADVPNLFGYVTLADSVEEFDLRFQRKWHMPNEYKELDIAEHILSLCTQDYELQRVAEELLLYQERDLFDLLRYLKYLVDTLRKNNLVWGVGRGSSVASYVLFLLGVHKINSLYYDLSIDEFLK
jgi:DNA polymerase III alpha subunit